MNSATLKLILGYIAICLIWGSTWVVIRLGLDSLTPMISAGIRFLLASLTIFSIIGFKNYKLPLDSLSIKLYFFMGIFSFAIPFWMVYWAEQFVPSGLTSVIFGVFPFSVFIFSWIFLKTEELDFFKTISVVIGFIGIVIIFSENLNMDLEIQFWGLVAVFVSAVMQGLVAVILKKYAGYLSPFSMNAYPLLIAGSVLILLSFGLEDSTNWAFTSTAVFSILYLATIGTIVTFTIYYWLLQRMNVVILSLSSFITPIIAVILGWIILDERLSQKVLLGSLLVLMGILLSNFKSLKKLVVQKIK
ncbi:MAG: DMT family transporter [Ignavibacteriae bacterium]|nr:DMT family transporter [Ignavibacteriota bacterium]